jgi:hypothetical protein
VGIRAWERSGTAHTGLDTGRAVGPLTRAWALGAQWERLLGALGMHGEATRYYGNTYVDIISWAAARRGEATGQLRRGTPSSLGVGVWKAQPRRIGLRPPTPQRAFYTPTPSSSGLLLYSCSRSCRPRLMGGADPNILDLARMPISHLYTRPLRHCKNHPSPSLALP